MKSGKFTVVGLVFVFLSATFGAKAVFAEEARSISGMSVVGNNETPKSLYIVPWKSSEIGMETDLSSNLLNESLTPVDKDVFMREVDFHEVSTTK